MKSGKQRRAELDAKKLARAAKAAARLADATRAALGCEAAGGVRVNRAALASHNSHGEPEFAIHGFYSDQPFECVDCGKAEVWKAGQQKWWYEVAKGDVFTTARRCRVCRRRERERRADVRRAHLDGVACKQQRRAESAATSDRRGMSASPQLLATADPTAAEPGRSAAVEPPGG